MPPNPMTPFMGASPSAKLMKRVLGNLSIFTIAMTVPQVLKIWVSYQGAGISMVSWGAYLLSAGIWLWHGLQKRDENVYLACMGWMGLDTAVIVGALVYG